MTSTDPRVTKYLRTLADNPQLDFDVARFRTALEAHRRFAGEARPLHTVLDVHPHDHPALRIYQPDSDTAHPVLVYLHGGAFLRGDLDAADVSCREIAARGPAVVVSVDYRLAPEHPYPAAIDDTLAALSWTSSEISAHGGDPDAISIGGDSAGANIATVAAHQLRPAVHSQILISGVFDLNDRLTPLPNGSLDTTADTTADQQRLHWIGRLYAGTVATDNPRVSPLRRADLTGSPPALIVTSGLDPFIGQARRYADALTTAGAAAELVEFPGMPHGFSNLAGLFTEEAHDLYDRVAAALHTTARDRTQTPGVTGDTVTPRPTPRVG